MSVTVDVADLGSPFHTPRTKRYATHLDAESPPLSTPRQPLTTRRRHSLLSSPGTTISIPTTTTYMLKRPPKAVPTTGLKDLPVELVQEIHLLADNPKFPFVSQHVYYSLKGASPHYVAQYMLHQYRDFHSRDILTYAIRRPVVTVPVAEEMRRLWDLRRGYRPRHNRTVLSSEDEYDPGSERSTRASTPATAPSTPHRRKVSRPPLDVYLLPRRLFRIRPGPKDPAIHPMIRYLFDNFNPQPNSHSGQPLARAVFFQNYDLVEYLIAHGASPAVHEFKAMSTAIAKKDLRMVKLLLEPLEASEAPSGSSRSSRKKRRISDRFKVHPELVKLAMDCKAQDIVEYFVTEKGALPPLNEIMALGKS